MSKTQALKPELDLFDSFASQLRQRFEGMDELGRWRLLGSLRRLTNSPVEKKDFDGEQAKDIRLGLRLTRKELCKKIGNLHEVTLYKYEAGILNPTSRRAEKVAGKYLKLLKKNGYRKPEEKPAPV